LNTAIITERGGSITKTDAAVACVSLWHIPGGASYDLATVVYAFFEDMEKAEAFQKAFEFPPEMAYLEKLEPTNGNAQAD
jgi:hypothetical protein